MTSARRSTTRVIGGLALLGVVAAVALLAPAAPVGSAARTPPVASPVDGWELVDGDAVIRYEGGGAGRTGTRASGPGFNTFPSVERNRGSYTLRLVTTPEIENYRDDVVAAAADLAAATAGTYAVAPGTIPDRDPVEGEILVRVTASSPCGDLTAGPVGCGGPSVVGTTAVDGEVWLSPDLDELPVGVQYSVVAHELGHAVGLAHFNEQYGGLYQVMRSYADTDLDSYRAGDINGLRYLHPPAAPANDAFGAAVALPASGDTRTGTTVSAGSQPGEPDHGGDGHTVWYRFTAADGGRLVLTVDAEDPYTYAFLGLYTGGAVSGLTELDTLSRRYRDLGERAAVALDGGVTARIAVDSYGETPFTLDHAWYDCDPAGFPDVGAANPFCVDITWMADEGITGGFPDGTFRPTGSVTRQSMAAFLYRMAGSPAGAPTATRAFSDVPPDHPFATEIAWMVSEGIADGYPDGSFRPGAPVSRQAMSAFLYRLAGEPSISGFETAVFFWDVPVTHPFHREIVWMRLEDISTGYPDYSYRPAEAVTRQAMSAFLFRDQLYG